MKPSFFDAMSLQPDAHPHATVGTGLGGNYEWFDRTRAVEHAWGRHLPHWRQPGAIYFVTFRTADSIPAEVLAQWQHERAAWLLANPLPHHEELQRDYHRRFTKRMHLFLDEGHGACPFKDPGARQYVVEALHARDGSEYALDAFVVMPNHAHILVAPREETDLSTITKAWKRLSAHRVNRLLSRRGRFWQHESWDHLVRTPDHLDRYRLYVEANPRHLPAA